MTRTETLYCWAHEHHHNHHHQEDVWGLQHDDPPGGGHQEVGGQVHPPAPATPAPRHLGPDVTSSYFGPVEGWLICYYQIDRAICLMIIAFLDFFL